MKKFFVILGMICCMMQGHAQNKTNSSSQDSFSDFLKSIHDEFDEFRSKIKEEHIEFMRKAWKEFESSRPIPKPKDEKRPPVVMSKGEDIKHREVKKVVVNEVVMPVSSSASDTDRRRRYRRRHPSVVKPRPKVVTPQTTTPVKPKEEQQIDTVVPVIVQPETIVPVVIEPAQPIAINPYEPIEIGPAKHQRDDDAMEVSFYGTTVKVYFDPSKMLRLKGISENNVADGFKMLANSKDHEVLLDNCLSVKKGLNLNDWAYLQFLKTVAYEMGDGFTNESTLLLAYLYMRSGYKMRIAKDNTRLYMLYGSNHQIYDKPSYRLDGDSYYGIEDLPRSLNICNLSFDKELTMSLILNDVPQLMDEITERREIVSERYPDVKVTVSVNKNLLKFFDSYPSSMYGGNLMTRWAIYADTPLEKSVEEELYPQLDKYIAGKSQLEAANILLNWIQTGFEYEYDANVWGGDRAFFSEETLHYPYCDCEDRSILFTRLVRDLLGLKCLLIYYPGHLASAVCFTEDVDGDYIQLNNEKYIVADGTYINAPVGMTMPDMDNATAKVIVLE